MLKNSLAIIVIGSFVTGSSFANPLNVKSMFMQDQTLKSYMASKLHTQNSQSKFSGTWAGTCSHAGETNEEKILIDDDDFELSIKDLINEGGTDAHFFNSVESQTITDEYFHQSYTNRLTKIDENTINFQGNALFATTSNKEKGFSSGVYNASLKVNNNLLTIVTKSKRGKENELVDKCILKRVG